MIKHLKDYYTNMNVDKKQRTLGIEKWQEDYLNAMNLKLVEFNHEKIIIALVRMLIVDELPF